LNESVSDAAANTVMLPVTGGVVVVVGAAAVVAAAVVGAAVVATVVVAPEPLPLELPHAAATSPSRASGRRNRRVVGFMAGHHSQLLTDTPSGTE
jgi:hypothetical protein